MSDDLPPRLRAVCDLISPLVQEYGGRHEYDGRVPDYSAAGVAAALGRLGQGEPLDDPHDEAHLSTFEEHLRVVFGELELHRRNPMFHLEALDLARYDREYAPAAERAAARRAHLARWPETIDTAVTVLEAVPAPVAGALLGAVRGLAAGIPADAGSAGPAARGAHARLVAHLENAAADGDPDASLGGAALSRLMGSAEGVTVDLDRLAARADAERDRLMALLSEACARLDGGRPALAVCRELVRDHPDSGGVIEASRHWTERAIAFTRERDLVPYHDGECRVGLAPPSRRWAMAMMTSAAPGEPEGPSWYHITPPDPSWPEQDIEDWLEVFSATTLPGITVHEVAPGHFSHGRAIRRAPTPVRRVLHSEAFVEGWAHYAEELCVEEGFRADASATSDTSADTSADATRFEIGIWLEGLVRVTRLACAIGLHTGAMTVQEGAGKFAADTHTAGPAALAEAQRACYDPTYGRYTWGKLAIMDLREKARERWGAAYSHKRFHTALFDLGSPPLGLIETALERG